MRACLISMVWTVAGLFAGCAAAPTTDVPFDASDASSDASSTVDAGPDSMSDASGPPPDASAPPPPDASAPPPPDASMPDGGIDAAVELSPTTGSLEATSRINGLKGVAIAVDSHDRPHLVFSSEHSGSLRYATWSGSAWVFETIDADGMSSYVSIALDADDLPRVSYYRNSSEPGLRVAQRGAADWTQTVVDATGNVGAYSDIAIDAAGGTHVVYQRSDTSDARYAYKSAFGTWTTSTIESAGYVGERGSIAIDASNRPHVSYQARDAGSGGTEHGIRYAHFDGSVWHYELVEPLNRLSEMSSSIAIGPSGEPRIAYADEFDARLRFASRSGTGWLLDTIAVDPYRGYQASLALDTSGSPYALDIDVETERVALHRRSGTSWSTLVVDDGAQAAGAALAVDSRRRSHIVYQDQTSHTLRYALVGAPLL